jgi:hypothetical protein
MAGASGQKPGAEQNRRTVTPEYAARYAVRICGRVSCLSDPIGRRYFIVIPGAVVPPKWLEIAFRNKGKRDDVGHGPEAKVVMHFPIEKEVFIRTTLLELISGEIPKAKIRGPRELQDCSSLASGDIGSLANAFGC